MEFTRAGVLSLSAMLMACGAGARVVASQEVRLDSATSATRARPSSAAPATPALEQKLQAGDYVVYRFSGSFRKTSPAPLTLTERVLEREGGVVALEVVLDDGGKKQTLHIHMDATPGAAREVFDVTRVEAGNERPSSVAAYEAMMARTVVAADQNEEQLETETTNVVLGGKTLACTKTRYRVRVGKHEATMSTVASDAFPWGDVAGDITTLDGQVVYRVEVVDVGTQARERNDGVVAVAP
jgi:hypothetical protein